MTQTPLTEQDIERRSAAIGRKCGECSLCCLLLDVREAGKKDGEWCPHCKPGKGGCMIYDHRPHRCRGYACAWLVNETIPEHWYPLKSHMILDFAKGDPATLRVHVHPDHPDRWKQEPFLSDIGKLVQWAVRSRFKMLIDGNDVTLDGKDLDAA